MGSGGSGTPPLTPSCLKASSFRGPVFFNPSSCRKGLPISLTSQLRFAWQASPRGGPPPPGQDLQPDRSRAPRGGEPQSGAGVPWPGPCVWPIALRPYGVVWRQSERGILPSTTLFFQPRISIPPLQPGLNQAVQIAS